ncbi:MAG: hypothetical protein KatS3mg048_0732 [Caldilinea sp.]|nr:MAG: hypothetical protein KatS3mg048_0732 [Caldilinea sp.]
MSDLPSVSFSLDQLKREIIHLRRGKRQDIIVLIN